MYVSFPSANKIKRRNEGGQLCREIFTRYLPGHKNVSYIIQHLYWTLVDSSVPNSSRYTGPSSKDHPLLVYCCYMQGEESVPARNSYGFWFERGEIIIRPLDVAGIKPRSQR